VRVLIDEHYAPEIARQLRDRGHDAVSVHEDDALEGSLDESLFETAAKRGRAIVTENVPDFLPLQDRATRKGRPSYGLVCVSARRFPRSSETIKEIVDALDAYLAMNPDHDALQRQGGIHWPQKASG
jgi:predicted nuclease of predicted toxin-antitoxin system